MPDPNISIKFRFEKLCDEFERRWRNAIDAQDSNATPRIENVIDQVQPNEKEYLLYELMVIELFFRRKTSEQPEIAEYIDRFGDFKKIIESAFFLDPGQQTTDGAGNEVVSKFIVPEKIDRYSILETIGHGAFGAVFRARDDSLQRDVAIKIPTWTRNAEDEKQLILEAQIVAKLQHPNIVKVFDVLSTDEFPCILVSEFIAGTDLDRCMATEPPDLPEAVRIVETIAGALHFAHTHGLVHRDVKPANILLDSSGKAFLTDFGLALTDEEYGRRGPQGGTVAYMSPEQARGEGHLVRGTSDIFSLGIILYELLVGRRPFDGKNWDEVLHRIRTVEPQPLRLFDTNIPREIERICMKALAKRTTDRFALASDMAHELKVFVEEFESGKLVDSHRLQRRQSIVPKGLRCFDAEDSDFFIELIPGPRDRHGLPDSIRFWKTRLESSDAGMSFRVGVMYGISGCGKSSLMRAGILPRLAQHVTLVYLEATPDDIELQVYQRLRQSIPDIGEFADVVTILQRIRQGEFLPIGQKLVIVIDQFEQWLQSNREMESSDLVAALRQCDGRRVQAVLMIRDDFWIPLSRFMKELEVPIIEAKNAAPVDSFDQKHTKKVLTALGIAYERLEMLPSGLPLEQKSFVDRAVNDLAESGRVPPVRVAVFAEVVKDQPWNLTTYASLGSAASAGKLFLRRTFGDSTSHVRHRQHKLSIIAVLEAMLPDAGTIKGKHVSEAELRQIAGYVDKPSAFQDMMFMLDGELRLISAVDVGQENNNSTQAHRNQSHRYQLTHDYLVPNIREWIAEEKGKTMRGRAQMRLEELTQLWTADSTKSFRPPLRDFTKCRILTSSTRWTDSQKKMMATTGRYYLLLSVLVVALFTISLAFLGSRISRLEVEQIVNNVRMVRDLEDIDGLISETKWSRLETALLDEFNRLNDDNKIQQMIPIAVALRVLESDDKDVVDFILNYIKTFPDPSKLSVLCDAIRDSAQSVIPEFWEKLAITEDPLERIRTVIILCRLDPKGESGQWSGIGAMMAEDFSHLLLEEKVRDWFDELRPDVETLLSNEFTERLVELLNPKSKIPEPRRDRVIFILSLVKNPDPVKTVRALSWAKEGEFGRLLALLGTDVEVIHKLWGVINANEPNRRFNLAMAAAELGDFSLVSVLLQVIEKDPTLQTRLIFEMPNRFDQKLIANQLEKAIGDNETILAMHLVHMLGTFWEPSPKPNLSDQELQWLKEAFQMNPHPGLHFAIEWLLKLVNAELPNEMRLAQSPGTETESLVLTRRGDLEIALNISQFHAGSEEKELGHDVKDEKRRLVIVNRRIAAAPKMVTRGQYRAIVGSIPQTASGMSNLSDDCPLTNIDLYDIAEYCNRLSDVEGLEQCFVITENKIRLKENYLSLNGYRLPTALELEYMSRAKTTTIRHFGTNEVLLPYYALYENTISLERRTPKYTRGCQPVAMLRPNQFGFFDLLGNAFELTLTREHSSPSDVDHEDTILEISNEDLWARMGGGFTSEPSSLRSAQRAKGVSTKTADPKNGFRVVRTLQQYHRNVDSK